MSVLWFLGNAALWAIAIVYLQTHSHMWSTRVNVDLCKWRSIVLVNIVSVCVNRCLIMSVCVVWTLAYTNTPPPPMSHECMWSKVARRFIGMLSRQNIYLHDWEIHSRLSRAPCSSNMDNNLMTTILTVLNENSLHFHANLRFFHLFVVNGMKCNAHFWSCVRTKTMKIKKTSFLLLIDLCFSFSFISISIMSNNSRKKKQLHSQHKKYN